MSNKLKVIEKIKRDLRIQIANYESDPELDWLINKNMTKFDTSQMPDIIQKMVKLVTTKASTFSDISAVGISTFVLSGIFGQMRPVINTQVYSDDILGVNFYGFIFAASGKGKDSAYQAILKSCGKASDFIQQLKENEAKERAKNHYIKVTEGSDPEFDKTQVVYDDYADIAERMIENIEPTVADLKSSRGGLTTSMNRMTEATYGGISIFNSELSMTIESSPHPPETLELLATTYDMGEAQVSSFKTVDAKEKAISGVYPNFLGISNANSLYIDGPTRNVMVPKLKGAFLRRSFSIHSNIAEDFQNVYIPLTRKEKREIQAENRITIARLSEEINEIVLQSIKLLTEDATVSFDVEADALYDDYKGYTEGISQLMSLEDYNSTEATEIAGKAFKTGRVAAIFALAQGKKVVDKATLQAAILFADHCSVHSKRLMKTLSLKNYQLMVLHYNEGQFGSTLSLSDAISAGYITTGKTGERAIQEFLNPVNSDMKGKCVVSYDAKNHTFVFTDIVKNTENLYGYRAVSGISDDRPVPKALTRELDKLGKPLVIDSSINPFVDDTTKLVMLTVDKALLSMDKINHYLANTTHWIATKKDKTDEHSYTIILPVNIEINREDYKFIAMSIAEQLLLKVKPEHCEPETVHHGYANAVQLTSNENSTLFDVSGILANVATSTTTPRLSTKTSAKPTPSAINKFVTTEIEDNLGTIIEITDISSTPLLFLASLVYTMKCKWVPDEQVLEIIQNINSSIRNSYSEEVIQEFVIEPFKGM